MKRHWHLKALAFIIGLGLLFFGLHEAQTDPTLRVLKQVSIAEIERGELPKEDQYIQVNDAYLVGSYMIEYSHSRKHGDSAHVFAPLGSLAMQKLSSENKPLKPGLWVRLETDFRTKEAAEAAMQQDALYQKPYPVTGVVRSLESSVKTKMHEDGKLQIDQPIALHAGSTPLSLGNSTALAFVGGLIWALIAVWTWSDVAAAKWLARLAQSTGAEVFQGHSAQVLWAVLGAPVFLVAAAIGIDLWIDEHFFGLTPMVWAAIGLALFVWGLWRSRAAALLTPDALELVRNRKRTGLSLAKVTGVLVEERKVKGVVICKYTLENEGGKPFQIGSSLFKGGIDNATEFGKRLRGHLFDLLAPPLAAKLQRGERVSFGPLSLNGLGIAKGKRGDDGEVLPWSEVGSATLKNGDLKIKQKGKMFGWGSFPAKKLLNVDVLMHLLQSKGL